MTVSKQQNQYFIMNPPLMCLQLMIAGFTLQNRTFPHTSATDRCVRGRPSCDVNSATFALMSTQGFALRRHVWSGMCSHTWQAPSCVRADAGE